MSNIKEPLMEALVLDSEGQQNASLWEQVAKEVPGRKDIKGWCERVCVYGR